MLQGLGLGFSDVLLELRCFGVEGFNCQFRVQDFRLQFPRASDFQCLVRLGFLVLRWWDEPLAAKLFKTRQELS